MKHNLHNNNGEGQNPSPLTPKTRKGTEIMNAKFERAKSLVKMLIERDNAREEFELELTEVTQPDLLRITPKRTNTIFPVNELVSIANISGLHCYCSLIYENGKAKPELVLW